MPAIIHTDYNDNTHESPLCKRCWREYSDFDIFLEHFRRSVGAKGDPSSVAEKMMREWTTLMPRDCAAISLSRMAIMRRPYEERTNRQMA